MASLCWAHTCMAWEWVWPTGTKISIGPKHFQVLTPDFWLLTPECLCMCIRGHGSYRFIIMLEKCGHSDLNVFHLKWIIDTHSKWKNQNPGGRFGATSSANPAHLPQKWAKWAKLIVLFSWHVAPKWPQDFDFFNCHGCRLFIWGEKTLRSGCPHFSSIIIHL